MAGNDGAGRHTYRRRPARWAIAGRAFLNTRTGSDPVLTHAAIDRRAVTGRSADVADITAFAPGCGKGAFGGRRRAPAGG